MTFPGKLSRVQLKIEICVDSLNRKLYCSKSYGDSYAEILLVDSPLESKRTPLFSHAHVNHHPFHVLQLVLLARSLAYVHAASLP
jgi:hypothetical protein